MNSASCHTILVKVGEALLRPTIILLCCKCVCVCVCVCVLSPV